MDLAGSISVLPIEREVVVLRRVGVMVLAASIARYWFAATDIATL